MPSFRKALGVAAFVVLGIQTKETKMVTKIQDKNVTLKPGAFKQKRAGKQLLPSIDPGKKMVQSIQADKKAAGPGQPVQKEGVKTQSPQPVQAKAGVTQALPTPQFQMAVAVPAGLQSQPGPEPAPPPVLREALAQPAAGSPGKAAEAIPEQDSALLSIPELPRIEDIGPIIIPTPIPLEDVVNNGAPPTPTEPADLGPEPVLKQIENVQEILNNPEVAKLAVAPEIDAGATAASGDKVEIKAPEEPPKIDIQEAISSLFEDAVDEDLSSLDVLIASLPDVEMEELLLEIKDVESILGEYIKL